MHDQPTLCQCGCGESVKLAPKDRPNRGWIKGQPMRFVAGHHSRKYPGGWITEDRSYLTPCHIWQGPQATGYGRGSCDGRYVLAHRLAWIDANGPIPGGLCVLHHCGVPLCVNVEHLFLGTSAERQVPMQGQATWLCNCGCGQPRRSFDERFWEKVAEDEHGCWIWAGVLDRDGYGRVSHDNCAHRTHIYAYQSVVGLVPAGLQLDHLCRNRACVNPAHLEPVTPRENIRRGIAARGTRTHCKKRGHAMTEENVYLWRGNRICRKCRAIAEARRTAKRRVLRWNDLADSGVEPAAFGGTSTETKDGGHDV